MRLSSLPQRYSKFRRSEGPRAEREVVGGRVRGDGQRVGPGTPRQGLDAGLEAEAEAGGRRGAARGGDALLGSSGGWRQEGRRFGEGEGARGRGGTDGGGGGAGGLAGVQLPPASRGSRLRGGRSAERSTAEPREAARAPAPAPVPVPARSPERAPQPRAAVPRTRRHRREGSRRRASCERAPPTRKVSPRPLAGVGAGSGRRSWKVWGPAPPCSPHAAAAPPGTWGPPHAAPGVLLDAAREWGGVGIPGRSREAQQPSSTQTSTPELGGPGTVSPRACQESAEGRGLRPGQVQSRWAPNAPGGGVGASGERRGVAGVVARFGVSARAAPGKGLRATPPGRTGRDQGLGAAIRAGRAVGPGSGTEDGLPLGSLAAGRGGGATRSSRTAVIP